MNLDIEKIKKLVGEISNEQLKNVDCFIIDGLGMFIPVIGPCYYAITPSHMHPAYSFVLTFDDYCKVKINDKIIDSEPNKLYAYSPFVPHEEILNEKGFARYIAVFIDKKIFNRCLNKYSINEKKIFKGEDFDQNPELISIIKEFMLEYENGLPGFIEILFAIRLRIIHKIIRICYQVERKNVSISSRLDIDKVINYLHRNFYKKITVKEMAKLIAMSSSHFSRIFKKEIGKAPMDYLIKLRLDKAKKLLRVGGKSITDIALSCGFNSSAHFSTYFHKQFHITPSEYKLHLN